MLHGFAFNCETAKRNGHDILPVFMYYEILASLCPYLVFSIRYLFHHSLKVLALHVSHAWEVFCNFTGSQFTRLLYEMWPSRAPYEWWFLNQCPTIAFYCLVSTTLICCYSVFYCFPFMDTSHFKPISLRKQNSTHYAEMIGWVLMNARWFVHDKFIQCQVGFIFKLNPAVLIAAAPIFKHIKFHAVPFPVSLSEVFIYLLFNFFC